jgi:hypothetical protein
MKTTAYALLQTSSVIRNTEDDQAAWLKHNSAPGLALEQQHRTLCHSRRPLSAEEWTVRIPKNVSVYMEFIDNKFKNGAMKYVVSPGRSSLV